MVVSVVVGEVVWVLVGVVVRDVVAVVAVAFVLSLLASVYPAWRAAQVPPAEVLNYV